MALIAVGLALPVILSLPAILKGTNVSVQDALGDCGTVVGPTSPIVPRSAGFRMPLSLLLAISNGLRQKRRLAMTVATMGLGVAIFSTGFNVRASLATLLTEVTTRMGHDVQVVLPGYGAVERPG